MDFDFDASGFTDNWIVTQPRQERVMEAWTEDFLRAFYARPKILRNLALLCMGRYARNELLGLAVSYFVHTKYPPPMPDLIGYCLEKQDYHPILDKQSFDDLKAVEQALWPSDDGKHS